MTDKEALDIFWTFVKDDGTLNNRAMSKVSIKKHYLKLFDFIENRFKDTKNPSEVFYRLKNHIEENPKCPICGNNLEFIRFSRGYRDYCSKKCRIEGTKSSISKSHLEYSKEKKENVEKKKKETCLKKYGKEFVAQVEEFKQKEKETCLKKYGVEYSFQSDNNKEKSKKTLIEHYGVTTPMKSDSIKNKVKKTCQEKYRSDLYWTCEDFYRKSNETKRKNLHEKWLDLGYDVDFLGTGEVLVHNVCEKHKEIKIPLGLFHNRVVNKQIICPTCNPVYKSYESSYEIELFEFIKSLGIEVEQHNRKILQGRELDLFIPRFNFAIEVNSVYWHSSLFKSKDYHLNKLKLCQEKGIQLLQFWENDLQNKKEIVKDIISSKLGLNKRIFARKCQIKEIDSKTSKEFLDQNHLQGNVNASIRLGLFYKDELVEVMTFGKLRKALGSKSEENCYELYRLCTKNGLSVVGGASKLFKHFLKEYKPKEVISYCHNDISNGSVYKKLEFEDSNNLTLGYFYVDPRGNIYNRFTLRKSKVDDGSGRTADEILTSKEIFKCYNSGVKKFVYKS